MTDFIQVTTAVDNEEDAETIASALVSQRLAACVQIVGPVKSTFWWDNDVQVSEEWLCLIKTRADLFEELRPSSSRCTPMTCRKCWPTPIVAGGKATWTGCRGELKQASTPQTIP